MMDANENIASHKSSINKFMLDTNMTPVHHHFPSASYTRGTSCIDFIFSTQGIKEAITFAGYLPFYDGVWISDHRGVYADIDTTALFYGTRPHNNKNIKKKLSSNNLSQVLRFIDTLERENKLNDILDKLNRIQSISEWNAAHHIELEHADQQFTAALLSAEKRCINQHHAAWHPKLHHCFLIYSYWQKAVSGRRNRKHTTAQLNDIQQKLQLLNIDHLQGSVTRTSISQLRLAKQRLITARADATYERQQHLTLRQEILVIQGKKKQALAVAAVQRAERRARCFKKFHTFTKDPRSSGGLTYVIQTDQHGVQTRTQQPDELEEILFHRNRRHFAQEDGTPFTRPPLSNQLTFSGISPFGMSVLDGTAPTDDIPASAAAILQELKRIRLPLPQYMPFNDMISGLTKWREQTTTSPSNKHLGIYKSLIQHHKITLTKERNNSTTSSAPPSTAHTALIIQHKLINLAIRHTHTFTRWKTVHNFFIEKSQENHS
jgi:hypothetical protein